MVAMKASQALSCVLCRLHGVFDLGMVNACEVTNADSTSHLQIMDGQQRIVTICLMYAAIRRILDDGGADELKFAKGSVICSCTQKNDMLVVPGQHTISMVRAHHFCLSCKTHLGYCQVIANCPS